MNKNISDLQKTYEYCFLTLSEKTHMQKYKTSELIDVSEINIENYSLEEIMQDLTTLSSLIFTVSDCMARTKTIAKKQFSATDYEMYKNNKEYHKISSRSSTTHAKNIEGMKENALATYLSDAYVALERNLRSSIDALRSLLSTKRFLMEMHKNTHNHQT